MKIGIVGAGNIGGTLARKLSAAGHAVKLAGSKGLEEVRDQAELAGAEPVTAKEAVTDVKVIILSIPFGQISMVASLFADVPSDVVVIDTSNYYPQRDGQITEVDEGKPESVWSSEQLGRSVVKAFNAVLAHTLTHDGMPPHSDGRIALPVAGDDQLSKAMAKEIVETTGFDAFDAGELKESWRQQPGTPAYCTSLSLAELETALAAADRGCAQHNRDTLIGEFMLRTEAPTHKYIIARNRHVTAAERTKLP